MRALRHLSGCARELASFLGARRPSAPPRGTPPVETSPLDDTPVVAEPPSPKVVVHVRIRAALEAKLGRTLRPEEEALPFGALGLDSVTLLELAAALEEAYGVALADFAAYEHPTVTALASHVAELVAAKDTTAGAEPGGRPTRDVTLASSSPTPNAFELPRWTTRESS